MICHALVEVLADRGHQLDVVTVYPVKKTLKNHKVILDLQKVVNSTINQFTIKLASKIARNTIPIQTTLYGNDLCEYLGLPELQEVMKNPPQDPPYDLVIIEAFMSDCFVGVGYALNVPVIKVSPQIIYPWLETSVGQLQYPAFVPSRNTIYRHPMSFFTRVLNTIQNHYSQMLFHYYTDTVQNGQMRKYIDPNIPSIEELEKIVALVLVNSWPSLSGIQPTTPAIIPVGGLHIETNYVPLSEELERWMNESTSGVIYFTLGSMVNIETFPETTIRRFYTVFKQIAPVRVLMKVANKTALLPGLPDNVRTSSWIPQMAVLAHKNTKVFMTHGGLMSTLEAITFGVPLIGIPLWGDQFMNIANGQSLGFALMLNCEDPSEESISWAVNEILYNPTYREAAKQHSIKFLDRPMGPKETAVYWVEYAIRHGPEALRSPACDMTWWQVALLDVYGFLSICILIVVYIIIRIAKALLSALFRSKKHVKLTKSD
ncbi:UDP-glucosyltransferase 2-like isoform X2 [Diachasmimorpha longicaudata]